MKQIIVAMLPALVLGIGAVGCASETPSQDPTGNSVPANVSSGGDTAETTTVAASDNADGIATWDLRAVGASGFAMHARDAAGRAVAELRSGPEQSDSTVHLIVQVPGQEAGEVIATKNADGTITVKKNTLTSSATRHAQLASVDLKNTEVRYSCFGAVMNLAAASAAVATACTAGEAVAPVVACIGAVCWYVSAIDYMHEACS